MGHYWFNVSINLAYGHISISIKNGTDEGVEELFLLVSEYFPRATGLTDNELEQQTLKLTRLIKDARKASRLSKEAEKKSQEMIRSEETAKKTLQEIGNNKVEIETLKNEIEKLREESAQKAADISSFRNDVKSNRDSSQESSDQIGAIEAKIRDFFKEVDTSGKKMTSVTEEANETITQFKAKTLELIEQNQAIQEETKEHLLRAVGASLFSAFEKRKRRIEFSKWVWATLTVIALIAQIIVIFWIAGHVQSLKPGEIFYKTPGFMLRISVSIPILFLIGYSMHQYAREREFEELYAFKASISFSLSPYMDLVKKLQEVSNNPEFTKFAIEAIKEIFVNPLPAISDGERRGKTE